MLRPRRWTVLLLGALFVGACGDDLEVEPPPPQPLVDDRDPSVVNLAAFQGRTIPLDSLEMVLCASGDGTTVIDTIPENADLVLQVHDHRADVPNANKSVSKHWGLSEKPTDSLLVEFGRADAESLLEPSVALTRAARVTISFDRCSPYPNADSLLIVRLLNENNAKVLDNIERDAAGRTVSGETNNASDYALVMPK